MNEVLEIRLALLFTIAIWYIVVCMACMIMSMIYKIMRGRYGGG